MRYVRFAIALLVVCSAALAQSVTGTLTGIARDASGAVIPDAAVEVKSQSTGAVVKTSTTSIGLFTVPSLPPGDYTLSVQVTGFKTAVIRDIKISTAQITTQNVVLEVGEVADRVSVTGEAPLINPNSAAVTTTIETKLMQDLPFPDRSVLGVVLLSAGAQGDPQYNGGVQSELPGIFTQPVTPGASLSVGGGRPGGASILVDGSDVTSAGYARTVMTFSGDTIQEVSVQANGIPAQYGRTTSAIINQATRSGSNELHGSAQWAHIDPFFQTQALGSAFSPTSRYNQYGVSIGGPVLIPKLYDGRNRTFFFGTGEPQRQRLLFGAQRVRLPTGDELKGNFRNSWDFLDRTLRQVNVDQAIASPIRLNPLRYHYPLNTNGFPAGELISSTADWPIIPNNDLSGLLAKNPIAQKVVAALYPFTPGTSTQYIQWLRPDGLWDIDGNNAIFARGVSSVDNRWSAKVDHLLSDTDRLAGRYSTAPVTGTRFDWGGVESPGNPLAQDEMISRNAGLTWNHIFSGSLINETRVTYSRANAVRAASNAALSKDWGAELGLVPAVAGYGFPQVLNRGLNADGGNNGRTIDVNLGIGDDLSWVRGRHSIKVGGEFRHIELNRYTVGGVTGGNYSFAGQITPSEAGHGLNSFIDQFGGLITGSLNTYTYRPYQNEVYYRWKYYALYLQDDVRVNRALTLNLGLRYDIETPRTEKYDRQGSFDPNIAGTVNGRPVAGAFVWAGSNSRGRHLWPVNYRGLQPRIGLVWSAKPWMVWRASYNVLRAPITGLGLDIFPDISVPQVTLRSTNRSGGVQPGPINIITNPIAPLPGALTLTRDPVFFMNGTYNFDFTYIPQNSNMPYVQKWNFGTQLLAGKGFSVEIAYDGAKGTHLFASSYPLNAVPVELAADLAARGADLNRNATEYNPLQIAGPTGQVLQGRLVDSLRAYPNWFNKVIRSSFDRSGNSIYHGLNLNLKKRFSAGFMFQGAYTWSKSIDDGSNNLQTTTIQDSFGIVNAQWRDRRLERSVSTFDLPHKLNLAYSWELPFGKGKPIGGGGSGWVDKIIGGYNLAGAVRLSSGPPLTAYNGGSGWFASRGGGNALEFYTVRPDRVPGVPVINPEWRKDPFRTSYLNPAAFAVPGSDGTPALGNAPSTLPDARGPAVKAFDMSGFKNIPLAREGRVYLQLRADAFNVLNHPNFFVNPGRGNASAFVFNATSRAWTPNNTFSTMDANNTAQFNNYAGRSFRVGARLFF